MKRMKAIQYSWFFALAMAGALMMTAVSCRKPEEKEPPGEVYSPTPYHPAYPSHFPFMTDTAENPLTKEGVELGRRLYYDEKLSFNGPNEGASCSSCHHQSSSFTINAGGTAVLPHVNLGWNKTFLWEGKVEGTLEDVMRFEVEVFFNTELEVLKNDPLYPSLFRKAFGAGEITYERTAFALAQFVRTLVSGNSKMDRWYRHEVNLSDAEMRGLNLFFTERGDCFHCHSFPLTSDNSFHNIGLDSVFSGASMGRYNVTGDPADMGKFKTPTLRNIELTAPYMHDGRFATLEEVVEHYSSGVKYSNTLDPIMTKQGKWLHLNLTTQEKADLVAFLKTFTDTSFISDPRLGSPF